MKFITLDGRTNKVIHIGTQAECTVYVSLKANTNIKFTILPMFADGRKMFVYYDSFEKGEYEDWDDAIEEILQQHSQGSNVDGIALVDSNEKELAVFGCNWKVDLEFFPPANVPEKKGQADEKSS